MYREPVVLWWYEGNQQIEKPESPKNHPEHDHNGCVYPLQVDTHADQKKGKGRLEYECYRVHKELLSSAKLPEEERTKLHLGRWMKVSLEGSLILSKPLSDHDGDHGGKERKYQTEEPEN